MAFAVVLTVAAGLSLAAEHAREPAAGPGRAVTSDLSHKEANPDGRAVGRNPSTMGGPEQNDQQNQQLYERRQAEPRIGVGSRALTEGDAEPSADERTR
jgi:hypothetical protein